jgi:hypothetical protein
MARMLDQNLMLGSITLIEVVPKIIIEEAKNELH